MKTTDCFHDTATVALAAAVMLAVPFSCLLVKALMYAFEEPEQLQPVPFRVR